MRLKQKTEKKQPKVLKLFVLFGILSLILVLFSIKLLNGGNILTWVTDPKSDLPAVSVIGLVIVVFIVTGFYALSKIAVGNAVFNLKLDIIGFLQSENILSPEYVVEERKNTPRVIKRIFKILLLVAERFKASETRRVELEDMLSKLIDVKKNELTAKSARDIEATILFIDIPGFSHITLKLSSNEIILFLNTYYEYVTALVEKNHGRVHKFMGDSIMSVFKEEGYSHEVTHPLRAINAAMEINTGFAKVLFDSGIEILKKMPIGVSFGINTGECVTGTVGSTSKLEHSYIGECINQALLISKRGSTGTVLIGADTYELTKRDIEAVESEPLKIKNHDYKVYLVKGMNVFSNMIER